MLLAKPLALLQAEQSVATAPLGRVAEAQLMQFVPIITLPAGQTHLKRVVLHERPFVQTQPKAFANPFEKVRSLQSLQSPFTTTKF